MKKQLSKHALLLIAVVFCTTVYGQLAMTRIVLPASYTAISTGTGATTSTATGDNALQSSVPLGFTFNYLGTNYTTIGISTNGFATFTGTASDPTNEDLYDSAGTTNAIAPWWDDLKVPATGSILYQLQGIPGTRTFTIQWTNVLSYSSSVTEKLNFQAILFEGSNNIEFHYGAVVSGTNDTLENATIGLKGAVGGNGDYLDAMTGSSFTGNSMIDATRDWPTHAIRFSPGMPTPIAGGTYTVGLAGDYTSLSEAVADMNHRGISGSVTLVLLDTLYDETAAHGSNWFPILLGPVAGNSSANTVTIRPQVNARATMSSPGSLNGVGINQLNTFAIQNVSEPVLAVIGMQYLTLKDLTLTKSNDIVDRGLLVINSSELLGTQHSLFQGIQVRLWRGNQATIGIEQTPTISPVSTGGANSYNTYMDFQVEDCHSGILILGNPSSPDIGTSLITSSPTTYNWVGSTAINDIGNGYRATFGISLNYQQNATVKNTVVRNVGTTIGAPVLGIAVQHAMGLTTIANNRIYGLRNLDIDSINNVIGLSLSVGSTGSNTMRVYNNVVYNLISSYNGTLTDYRQVRGIFVEPDSTATSVGTINIDFNSVRMGSASARSSNTAFELGTTSGPVLHVRNNIFSNFAGAQTSPAAHYAWVSSGTNATGNTGSTSNNNALYVSNATQGYLGLGGTTNYNNLSAWQTAMGQDGSSMSVDPMFVSAQDLHVSNVMLNAHAIPLSWVLTDMDNDPRASFPDIGADEFDVPVDLGASLLVAPVQNGCYSGSDPVIVQVKNYSNAEHNFSANPATLTVNITGPFSQTFNYAINNNSLNGGFPLAPNGTINVQVGTMNFYGVGNYYVDAWTTTMFDTTASNDTLHDIILFHPGFATASDTDICLGSSVTLTLIGNSNNNVQWQNSTDGGFTWVNETGVGSNTPTYTVTPTMPGQITYRTVMCDSLGSTTQVTLNVEPVPTSNFSYSVSNGTVTFNNLSSNGSSFIWDFGDNTNSALTNPSHTYSTSGTYTVMLIVTNNCGSDTMTTQITLTVGIDEATAMDGVNISPNPATDHFSVTLDQPASNVVVEITDVQGKLVQRRQFDNPGAGSPLEINVETFENGVYFVRIINGDSMYMQRVVVQK